MKVIIHTVAHMLNAVWFLDVGIANAFRVLGHSVRMVTYGDALPDPEDFCPDLSISCFHPAYSAETDYEGLMRLKAEFGTKIVVWGFPFGVPAANYTDEHEGLHPNRHLRLMARGLFDLCITYYPPDGVDFYYRPWTEDFGIPVRSLPFAADTTVFKPTVAREKLRTDLCFIGAIHRTKTHPFHAYVAPLLNRYQLAVSGRGWETWPVRTLTVIYGDEPSLLSSSSIALNLHMDLSREVPGMPVNMRTFQSIAGGAFEVSDHVPSIRSYFTDEEIPTACSPEEYEEIIDHFMRHPEQRYTYWKCAYDRTLAHHTYEHRVKELLGVLFA